MAQSSVEMYSPARVAAIIRPDVERSMETKVRRIVSAARRRAPRKTGRLRASIRMDRRTSGGQFASRGQEITSYEVSANTPYAGFVHGGTRPHVIRIRNASVLTDGTNFFGPVVNHPGTRPNRFLSDALEQVGL